MKKLGVIALFTLALATSFAEKTKLTIKNTIGGNSDALGEFDLYTQTKETDVNGDTQTETVFALGDQLQADLESTYVDARARLEVLYTNADDATVKLLVVPTGFVHVEPIPQFGVILGNNFYKRFAIPSGYLAAQDTTTKYARLLTDSLGYESYTTSGDIGVYSDGFAGGLTSSWTWGEAEQFYLKAAGGATVHIDGSNTEKAIDFGANAGIQQVFDFGFTAHDVAEDTRKFGVFAGLTSNPNLVLNAGFYYNFTSSDYLPEAKISHKKKGYNEYDKQKTKYAAGLSAGYLFAERGLGIYADMITGLTNEYIGKVKYYDASGNLTETKVTTIVRGESAVKYKDGVAQETDEYTAEAIPLYAQLRLTYQVTEAVQAAGNFKLRTMIRDSSQTWLTFYPRISIALPSKAGTVDAGIRLDMNMTRYEDGLSTLSVPLTYTYKFKKKF